MAENTNAAALGQLSQLKKSPRMPVLFLGHGSPMNALGGPYAETWRALGESLPRPKAILCISAHWYVEEKAVTAMIAPRTNHDFYGFPKPLYDIAIRRRATPGWPTASPTCWPRSWCATTMTGAWTTAPGRG